MALQHGALHARQTGEIALDECPVPPCLQDPSIDQKRAKRILANRLSAAKSKMKQKQNMEVGSAVAMTEER